jgi:outer membrane lipoprotein carrier protein
MTKTVHIFACLVLLLMAPLSAVAETARSRLDAYLTGFTQLESGFEQQLTDENGTLIEASSGRFYLQRPDRFRWEYQLPYQQTIISDGEHIYIYDRDLAQVTVKSAGAALGATPAALLSGTADVDASFEIQELGSEQGLDWLALRPRDAAEEFHTIRLAFDSAGLRVMQLNDNLGQTTTIRFANEQRDDGLEPSLFTFEIPEGVDVIQDQP